MEDAALFVRDRSAEYAERRAAVHAKLGQPEPSPLQRSAEQLVIAPLWSSLPSNFDESAATVSREIDKLSELHRVFLTPKLRSDDEEQRLRDAIDQETKSVQAYLKKLEHILVAGTQLKPNCAEEEARIVRSIRAKLSAQFKELAVHFKRVQEFYGTQLRRREQKANKYMRIGSDAAYETVKQEEKAAQFLEMGFTEQGLQSLLIEELRQEQTSKEIKEILDSIQEIHSMFEDVHIMVVDQGTMLDRIDYNVDKALASSSKARIELEKAREQQSTCSLM